jgi:hypothetical protein
MIHKLTAVLVSFLFFISCVSIRSTVRPGYSANIEKVFIIPYAGQEGSKRFMEGLGENLTSKFAVIGITSMVHNYDDMNPTEKEILKSKISEFNPNAILQIVQTVKQYYNNAPSGGVFELTMYEPGDSAYFWKANLKTSTGGWGGTGSSSQAADYVINKLKTDGIIKAINKQ